MTRIIGGAASGRRLATPPGTGTRPTSDRVREALFNRLEHLDLLHGARVLDLYAGSGALGLEAASRGAEHVTLVESDRRAAQVIRGNTRELALPGVDVVAGPVERVLANAPAEPAVDLALLDPPYKLSEQGLSAVLDRLLDWLVDQALVVVERDRRSPEPTWPALLDPGEPRRYGETVLWFADYREVGLGA